MTDTANAPERISDDDLRKLLDKATPGPWFTGVNFIGLHGETGFYRWIVEKLWDDEQGEADARLIALAPDLAKDRLEHATHCDELVAAAYVAASEKARAIAVEMELHAAIGSTTKAKAEAIEGAILSGAPDNARAALTAYGERMKAEGAREAQAKIARLTMIANELSWNKKTRDISNRLFAALQDNTDG